MSEDLALSVRHVTSGYREGGLLGKKTYQEVLHDVTFDVRHGDPGLGGRVRYRKIHAGPDHSGHGEAGRR